MPRFCLRLLALLVNSIVQYLLSCSFFTRTLSMTYNVLPEYLFCYYHIVNIFLHRLKFHLHTIIAFMSALNIFCTI